MRKNSIALIVILLILTGSATFSQQAAATAPSSADQKKLEKIHAMYQSYKKRAFPTAPDVTVEKLLQWEKVDSVVLLDVRSAKERRISMIPNAISQKEFEKNIEQYKQHKIIVYCTIGYRSGKQVVKMRKRGLDAYNLIGGVLAWSHEGQFFSASDGDSLRVHVYGKKWNLAA
ncbi:hypothetical protein BMS3Abin05_01002 [bacterium BMS3Abin05]|nr:hypothetical protein BMS3Abin05_01002 [bacterium BMS3Abin05]